MIRLQRWESGPYFAAFYLHIPDMRSFRYVCEIVKICPRSPVVSIKRVFRYRTPKSDRLLEPVTKWAELVSRLVRKQKGTLLRSFSLRLFDVVQAVAVTLWVGTLWSTGALVAPALFRMITDRMLAGNIAGHLFGVTAFIGLACGGCLLIVRLIRDRTGALRQPVFWLVVSMLVLVSVSQFGIQPVLAGLREQAYPEEVMQTASANRFAIWHAAAGILYLVQSTLGLVLVTLVVRADPR